MTGQRQPGFGGFAVPRGFYERPALRTALAQHDFGTVFQALRAEFGLSQQQLADITGMDQGWVSKIEGRKKVLENLAPVIRIANALGIPASLLGFGTAPGARSSWLTPGNFFQLATSAAFGVSVPEMAHLRQHPRPRHDDPRTPQRIDTADVTALRATITLHRQWDNRQGGGIMLAAARAHVRFARLLKAATCTDVVRADLHLAIAEAAMVAAWMSYDMGEHHDARVYWLLALDEARQADIESSADLMVDVLLDMAHQSLHLRNPHQALKLTDLANTVVARQHYPVSITTRSYLDINLAWCSAAQGKIDPTRRALDVAHQRYADADPATAAPWARHVGQPEIAAQHGHAFFLLSEALGDTNRTAAETFAAEAIDHLRSAVNGYGGDYARSAAVNLPGLASCLLRVGDIPAAVTTGHQAVAAITALSSRRPLVRLDRLADTALIIAQRHQDVADLRACIAKATAA